MNLNTLSEDEIIRDWSLSHNDNAFVLKFNKNYRLWIYLQLCSLKLFGQLLDNPNTLDSQIIGYACKSLNLSLAATVQISDRDATRTEHKKQIFEHLNFRKFEESISQFHAWIKSKTSTGVMVYEHLHQSAEEFLVSHKIALPTAYNLKREISSFCRQTQDALFSEIYQQFPPSFIQSIDDILAMPENGTTSWFQKFKEYPGSTTITHLQQYISQYAKLKEIDINPTHLSKIPPELSKYFYRLGKYYDGWEIKRFKPEKRYALMMVFLVESKKNIIDFIIQMHDQYITNVCRECKNIHEDRLKQYKRKNEKALDTLECFIDYTLELPDSKTINLDKMAGFSKHFTPIHGQKRQFDSFYKSLISSIMAQAMNIGFATMQDCTPGITAKMMRHINDSCIREETIKASNAELVNKHTRLSLSQVHGDGTLSSSDGQRFIINASSLLASFYPRYCGYYDKIIGVYTHMSDQYSVYNTNAISCSPRESLYVIDGLLNNNTILSIKEHTTDTGGYTEHIFALCFLLGIRFMPRIKDLKTQQLYRFDKNVSHGIFDPLLTKTISLSLIEEQLDQMIRIVASMKNNLCPAHEIIRRLSKGSPSDQISKAFTHLGRLLKTDYILQYITDPQLRDRVYWQLNKGEHRHALARWLFFANQGKFQVGDYEEIMNKTSCLSLLSNAVLYWNTIKMSEIVSQLRKNGESISDETLSHISLLPHKHVIPMGTYFTDISTTVM